MGWEDKFKAFMSNMVIVESDWKFVTSAGATLTVSTPIARVGVNGTGGLLRVQRDSDAQPTQLNFGGLGGGVGVSLIPTPANFSFSIPQMPSAGRVYKLPFAGRTLSLHELKGAFIMIEIGADFGPGGSGALMFLGGNTMIGAMMGPMQLPAILATSNACVRFGGMNATLIPANAGINIYAGGVF
ncbi:MAG: hypothetical protein KF685_03510 [Acidobacteria bacterium]|nr:hypothetical protein [Acidobacteriota bacterium]